MWMEVAVAAIIAIVTAAAVATAVLFCVYRLITLLGDPVTTKIEAEIKEDKAELKDMGAKLDERLAKLDEREKTERPWGSTSVGQSSRSGRKLKGHGVRMIP
jgi:Skp family chaperone for outer membrane proteins